MTVINSAALDPTTAVVCVCACACMCVMSFITQVQLACSRIPGTVQCLGTKRADETAFCWQSGELGHLWSSVPEGRKSPNTPRSRAHGHILSKHTWHTTGTWTTWCGVAKTAPQVHTIPVSVDSVCVCIGYIWMCLCVWEKEEASLGLVFLKRCYTYSINTQEN